MAEAAPDNTRTVDYLHQILVGRELSSFEAREEILKLLRTGDLLIDQRIKTPKDVKKHEPQKPIDITEPVSPQAWGRTLDLVVDGHHLVVGFLAAFKFPWRFYSFSIANLAAVEELLHRIGKPAIAGQPVDAHPTPTPIPTPAPAPIAKMERPSQDAPRVEWLEWAYRCSVGTDQLAGLTNKEELAKLSEKVGPNFKAGLTTLKEAKRRYWEKRGRALTNSD
jgi:hypothetical protein